MSEREKREETTIIECGLFRIDGPCVLCRGEGFFTPLEG